MNWSALVLLALVSLLPACATRMEATVNSYVDPGYSGGKTFTILPGSDKTSSDDLEFKEYAQLVSSALVKKGYSQATNAESADIAIYLTYSISDPKHTPYSYSAPVFGQTGGGSSNVSIQSRGPSGTTYTQGTVTSAPTYGVVGYNQYSGVRTEYTRSILVEAIDMNLYRAKNTRAQIWKTTLVSTGSKGNLREVMPLLVTAMEDYLGTSDTVTIRVDKKGNKKVVK